MTHIREIISTFGSAAKLGAVLGLSRFAIQKWVERGSIPAEYDLPLIEAARIRGLTITLEELARARLERARAARPLAPAPDAHEAA